MGAWPFLFLAIAGGAGVPPASAAAYDRFYANFQGEELMRAINADRRALGIAALAASPQLASASRDRSVTCPSDPVMTIRGRARDMADRGYLSHTIPGCSDAAGGSFSGFDLLAETGITWSLVAENIATNNYPSTNTAYPTGCAIGGGSCDGSIGLPWSVAVAARGWMNSSVHRSTMLSTSYTRFGCGAWDASGTHYYGCYFTGGGNAAVDSTGPAISDATGEGGLFAAGSTPTFTALADDASSLLAEGRATLDGKEIKGWAYDHAASATLSVTVPALTSGAHALEWQVRDTSMNLRTVQVAFTARAGTSTPAPATPHPATARPATPSPEPTAPPPTPGATSPSAGGPPSAVPPGTPAPSARGQATPPPAASTRPAQGTAAAPASGAPVTGGEAPGGEATPAGDGDDPALPATAAPTGTTLSSSTGNGGGGPPLVALLLIVGAMMIGAFALRGRRAAR